MAGPHRLGGEKALSHRNAVGLAARLGLGLAIALSVLPALAAQAPSPAGPLGTSARELAARYQKGTAEEKLLLDLLDSIDERAEAGDADAVDAAYQIHQALIGKRMTSGLLEERLVHIERALPLAKRLGEKETWRVTEQLGNALYESRRWVEADDILDRLASEVPADHFRLPTLRGTLANIARIQRDFDRAHDQLDAAEKSLRPGIRDAEGARADLHTQRAQVYLDQGLPRFALEERLRGTKILKAQAENVLRLANAAIQLAEIRLAMDDFESLVTEVGDALAWLGDREPKKRSALELRLGIALYRLEERDPSRPPAAEATFRRVLAADAAPGDHVSARLRLARLELARGRYAACADELRAARERIPSGASTLLDRAMADAIDAELRVAETAGREPDERRRALEDARRIAEATFAELRADWQSQAIRPFGRGFLLSSRARQLLGALVRVSLAIDDGPAGRARALHYVVEASQAGTLARELNSPVPDLASIRALLGDGEGLLVYFPTPESWHLFAIDRDEILHALLPAHLEIEPTRERLLLAVLQSPGELSETDRARRSRDLDESARALFERLVPEPVRGAFGRWTGVVVSGTDLVGYVPFEALIRDAAPLGLEMTVRYVPSLPIAVTLAERGERRRTGPPATRAGVLVAAPRPGADALAIDPDLDPIPMSREEALALVHADEDRPWEALLGESAALPSLTSDVLGASASIQFVAHGWHDARRDASPRIVLSPAGAGGSFLDSAALASIALPPVVVLTVCGVGRGTQRWGDPATTDLSGGAFRSPAVESVLLPYARLETGSALRLSGELHRRTAEGESLGRALLEARRTVARADGGRYADPFYHSLLHLHGLGDTCPLPASMTEGKRRFTSLAITAAAAGIAICAALAATAGARARRGSRSVDGSAQGPRGTGTGS